MVALSSAIIGAAVIGAGAAVVNGVQQSNAINKASKQQQAAADQSIAYQREARDYARQVLSKYSVQGDAARAKMNTFLDLKPAPASSMQGYSGALGTANPTGVLARNQSILSRFGEAGAEDSTLANYGFDGQDLTMQAQADPTQTPAETQEQAWAEYQQTPWGRIGQMEADKAGASFLSKAGSQGGALSGRTVRGMAEVANEAQLRNFTGYYGALGGVADTGFNADSGIASSGQTFANSAANTLAANAANQGNLTMQNAKAKADMTDDLASWVGWGIGNWPGATGAGGLSGSGSNTSTGGGSVVTRIR